MMHRGSTGVFAGLLASLALTACGGGQVQIPEPRPLVLYSGARLIVEDEDRLRTMYDWLEDQQQGIEEPGFLVAALPDPRDTWPWETYEFVPPDTARINFQRTHPDIRTAYEVYAHMHLMHEMGRIGRWLPEDSTATGYELERAIVDKVADAWLLGRVSFDLAPYELLDKIIYAREDGHLDGLLLTLQAAEFPEARREWLAVNPGADEDFRRWYRETFDEEAPEVRGGG